MSAPIDGPAFFSFRLTSPGWRRHRRLHLRTPFTVTPRREADAHARSKQRGRAAIRSLIRIASAHQDFPDTQTA
ncbi:hypothetical protein [Burkholderia anthina]|uniref:hypothetical protein n=1 Tax=Burkholderia anthina TaxID=179879 RepID=UPI00158915EB|nr:hypothetical protein [Burkholderia anthina]